MSFFGGSGGGRVGSIASSDVEEHATKNNARHAIISARIDDLE